MKFRHLANDRRFANAEYVETFFQEPCHTVGRLIKNQGSWNIGKFCHRSPALAGLNRQKALEEKAIRWQTGDAQGRDDGRGSGHGIDWVSGIVALTNQSITRVGNRRRTGVAYQGNPFAACEFCEKMRANSLRIVIVVGYEIGFVAEMMHKLSGNPAILTSDDIDVGQDTSCPRCDVFEIANGRCDHIEPRREFTRFRRLARLRSAFDWHLGNSLPLSTLLLQSRVRRISAILAVLGLAACGSDGSEGPEVATPATPPPVPSEPVLTGPVKIAFLAPLTGSASEVGQDLLAGAELALFDRTEDVQLLPRDTQSTQEGALLAARNAIADGAEIIIGPLFANNAQVIAPIAKAEGIKILSFSNDSTIASPDLFVFGFRPEEQVRRVVAYARTQGLLNVAAMAPADPYGLRAIRAWESMQDGAPPRDTLVPEGPESVIYPTEISQLTDVVREFTRYDERYEIALEELKEAIAELPEPDRAAFEENEEELEPEEAAPFEAADAILIADGGPRLRGIAALLTYYDIYPEATKLLGTELWADDPSALREAALQRGWIAGVDPVLTAGFDQDFVAVFGQQPHPLAILAYDVTSLAIQIAGTDRKFPSHLLTSQAGFSGRTGLFRMLPSGLTEHALAILEVDAGNLVVIDPMPIELPPIVVQ